MQSITLSGLNNNINETLNFGLIIAIGKNFSYLCQGLWC